jgi:hypothetical protein
VVSRVGAAAILPTPITRENTVFLCVDVQERWRSSYEEPAADGGKVAETLESCAMLTRAAGLLSVPLVAASQDSEYYGALMHEVASELPPGTTTVERTAFSAVTAEVRALLQVSEPASVSVS